MKSIIHVNRHMIAKNAKDGVDRPIFTIKSGGKTRYASEVVLEGCSKAVYSQKGLSCGAKAWIETHEPITLINEMSYQEAWNKE